MEYDLFIKIHRKIPTFHDFTRFSLMVKRFMILCIYIKFINITKILYLNNNNLTDKILNAPLNYIENMPNREYSKHFFSVKYG